MEDTDHILKAIKKIIKFLKAVILKNYQEKIV